MSNNSELFLIKEDHEDRVMRFKILGTTSSRLIEDKYHHDHVMTLDVPELRPRGIEQEQEQEQEQEDLREKKDQEDYDVSVRAAVCKRPSLEKLVKVEEDDVHDGFKTPTSLDHKIPAIKQCPPAPRPNKQLPMKRKSLIVLKKTPQPVDIIEEIEALFPHRSVSDLHRKIKKARQDDE